MKWHLCFFYFIIILFQNALAHPNHRSCIATVIGTHYFDRNLYKSDLAFTELDEEFANLDRYFLQPQRLEYILFVQIGTSNIGLTRFVRRHLIPAVPPDEASTRIHTYATNLNSTVIIKFRDFALPRYIEKNVNGTIRQLNWLGGRSISYNLYSGAVYAHHLIHEPILNHYDIIFKIDVDIRFRKQIDISIVGAMNQIGAVFMHSHFLLDQFTTGRVDALNRFSKHYGKKSKSSNHTWCNDGFIFYGNFIAYKANYMHSELNRQMSRFLYEHVDDWFRNRWTDQTLWPMYLCQWSNIPEIRNSSKILDMSFLRNQGYFIHGHWNNHLG